MNTKEKVYASFQHYDHKGRRLSIFGTPAEDGSGMEIMVFRCNKKDMFKKKFAWMAYSLCKNATVTLDGEEMRPEYESVPFTKKQEFMQYCNNRFYKLMKHAAGIPGIPLKASVKEETFGGPMVKRYRFIIVEYLSKW